MLGNDIEPELNALLSKKYIEKWSTPLQIPAIASETPTPPFPSFGFRTPSTLPRNVVLQLQV